MHHYEEVWIKENHPDFLSVYKRPMPVESGSDINSIRLFPLVDLNTGTWVIECTTADGETVREELALNLVTERLVELGAVTKTYFNNEFPSDPK